MHHNIFSSAFRGNGSKRDQKEKKNSQRFTLNGLLIATLLTCFSFLVGCSGGQKYRYTPVVQKQAKRAYNKPYKIKGKDYKPRSLYEYSGTGIASYYGGRDVFHGRKTSTGEIFNKNGLTAAHKTLPFPSVVRVTNIKNGRSIKLRINDRGPFVKGRIIDVSEKAARMLGFHHDGIAKVRVDCLVNESIRLAHSYNPKKSNPYTVFGDHPRLTGQKAKDRNQDEVTVRNLMQQKFKTITIPVHPYAAQQQSEQRSQDICSYNGSASYDASSSSLSITHENWLPPQKPSQKRTDRKQIHLYNARDVNDSLPVLNTIKSTKPVRTETTIKPLSRGTYIQVGTYGSLSNAGAFAKKVETRMGTKCRVYDSQHQSAQLYRVLVGPMSTKAATEKMLHELKIRNVTDAFIVVQK